MYMSTFDAGIGQIRGELNSYNSDRAHLLQLFTHLSQYTVIVVRIIRQTTSENTRTGDKSICAGGGDFGDIVNLHATVNLEADGKPGLIDEPSSITQLIERARNKTLPAKAWIHRHQQYHVNLVEHMLQVRQGCRWIENQSGTTTIVANQTQTAIDML